MFMLLCVHVTGVLFLVLAGNSALTMGFYWSMLHALTLVSRSYALLDLYFETHLSSVYAGIQNTASVAAYQGATQGVSRHQKMEVWREIHPSL